jgi:hypothetical protein
MAAGLGVQKWEMRGKVAHGGQSGVDFPFLRPAPPQAVILGLSLRLVKRRPVDKDRPQKA